MFFFNENIVRSTEKFYRHELIFKQKFQLKISYKNKKSYFLTFHYFFSFKSLLLSFRTKMSYHHPLDFNNDGRVDIRGS